jgi:hypothetical protein
VLDDVGHAFGFSPSQAVLPAGLRDVGSVLPLTHLVTAVQNAWFGFGWAGTDLAVLAAYARSSQLPGEPGSGCLAHRFVHCFAHAEGVT